MRTHVKMGARSTVIFRFVKRFNLEQNNIIFDAFTRLMFVLFSFVVVVVLVLVYQTTRRRVTIEP